MHWQPIETAPKGKSVLLYAGELCPLYCGKQRFGNLGEPQQDVHAWRCDSSGRFATPTHWMPLPAAPGEECLTCNGHGAVGNILTAEPCPDCTPGAAPAAPGVAEALDRMDALLDPANGLLTVSGTSATTIASRADMALIRAALAAKESP